MSQQPPPPPAANQPPLSEADSRQWAGLAHLLGGILGFIPPLVIWLIYRERDTTVASESAKALNFQLIALIGYIVGSILTVIFIGFLISAAVWVISLIYGIGNYQKVQRGEATTYPVNVTWVK